MPFADAPELRRVPLLDEAWKVHGHGRRLDAVRDAAHALRSRLAYGPRVVSVRTLPLARLAYPTRFALAGAARVPWPFVVMEHRCLLVQFVQPTSGGAVKTLLFNPTDVEGAKRAPYFARLVEKIPAVAVERLAGKFEPLEAQLAALGVAPADVDYVAFDHFHTQDLRGLLGVGDRAPRFPNAKLLAPRAEWDDWDRLHPLQRAWYVADGKLGVDVSRVVLTDGDLEIGDGVALVRTPGHTSGNQTLFVATDRGVWGCAENATCADAYAPLDSDIPGVRKHARALDLDLLPNSNTLEYGADQYTSMVLERIVVDRVPRAPSFVQMFPSSELVASPIAPGLAPTLGLGKIEVGEVVRQG